MVLQKVAWCCRRPHGVEGGVGCVRQHGAAEGRMVQAALEQLYLTRDIIKNVWGIIHIHINIIMIIYITKTIIIMQIIQKEK